MFADLICGWITVSDCNKIKQSITDFTKYLLYLVLTELNVTRNDKLYSHYKSIMMIIDWYDLCFSCPEWRTARITNLDTAGTL